MLPSVKSILSSAHLGTPFPWFRQAHESDTVHIRVGLRHEGGVLSREKILELANAYDKESGPIEAEG